MKYKRKYPIGAEIISTKGVHFRIWAPGHKKAKLVLEDDNDNPMSYDMERETGGYFSLLVPDAHAGSHYRFSFAKSSPLLADPASRFQPFGYSGPSRVIDPSYSWKDNSWPGIVMQGQVIYEMHIGTFTVEGTFKAALRELEELKELGITVIELMPINDYPGRFGWGYDGVNLYAPMHLYGEPKDVKAFVDKAHRLGIGVILDVVYNHLGPEGNQLALFSKHYFNKEKTTEWGKAINFDDASSREFFLTNAAYWIEEYHFDGLRVDATPWFYSLTPIHILADITKTVKKAGGDRNTIVIGENETQNVQLLWPYKQGGFGFDALWNDDFHHTSLVRLVGKREAYYTDYLGTPQEFISSYKYGFLYQGQYYAWQKKERGKPDLQLPPESFVVFLENHDQVANSSTGKRLHQLSEPGNYKALTCVLLLSPNTPLLFQGQEFASTRPFHYFADHSEALNRLIQIGRTKFLAQFPRLATSETRKELLDPSDPLTFANCKLDFNERKTNASAYQLHKDLIHLRKNDPVFKNIQNIQYDGAVLGTESFLIRFFGQENGDRLLIVNFGPDHYFNPAPEPLLVAGLDKKWEVLWSSESTIYDGAGTPPINVPYWKILGHSAIVLKTSTN